MPTLYKLTEDEHPAPFSPEARFAYTSPLLALLFHPIHAAYPPNVLWECEGEVDRPDSGKVKCHTLLPLHQIPKPEITLEHRIKFGILCAKQVESNLTWNLWANRWLSGEDRTEIAARAAAMAFVAAAASAWSAAGALASRATRAASAAESACGIAAHYGIPFDLDAIAKEACT